MGGDPGGQGHNWGAGRRGKSRGFPARVRRAILARDPDCTLGVPGVCTGASEEADHVVPVWVAQAQGWGEEDYDSIENGAGVCRACHRVKSQAETKAAQDAARQRKPSRKRPVKPHPGLLR